MDILSAAFAAVRRNAATVALYVAIMTVFWVLVEAPQLFLSEWMKSQVASVRLYHFAEGILEVLVVSVTQCLLFSKIAAVIDHPLWRISSPGDALRRFLRVWIIINLFQEAILYLPGLFADDGSGRTVAHLALLLHFALLVTAVPLAACVMFRGIVNWEETPRSFTPLFYELPRTLVLLFFSGLQVALEIQYWLLMDDATKTTAAKWAGLGLTALISAPSALIECVVFTGTWLICMTHREHGEDSDLDF